MDFRKYVRDKKCQRCSRRGAVIIRVQRENRKRKIALACSSTVITTISSYPCTEDSATLWSLK